MSVLALYRTSIFWSKIIPFYPKYKKKRSLQTCFLPKKINKKKFDVWTKTMDYPLWKMSIF